MDWVGGVFYHRLSDGAGPYKNSKVYCTMIEGCG